MSGQDVLDTLEGLLESSRRYEGYIVSLCPFHNDTRPSFFVYPDKYRCASCGKWGKTDTLLRQLSKSNHIVIHEQSFDKNPWTGWLKKMSLPEVVKVAQHILKERPSSYLKDRGISYKHQVRLGLGMLEDWIIFPIINQHRNIIGGVARAGIENTSPFKYVVPRDQDPNLLYVPSWSAVRNTSSFYLTFGIMDSISILLCGYASASTTTGKRIDAEAFTDLRKTILIFPDHGERKQAYNLANHLGWRGHVVKYDYPDGTKDPNDLYTLGVLKNVLQTSTHS